MQAHSRNKRRQLPGHFLLGSTRGIQRDPLLFGLEMARQYGDIVRIRFLFWPACLSCFCDSTKASQDHFWGTVPYRGQKHEPTLTAAQCDDSNSSTRFLPCLRQKFSLVFPLSPHRMSSERTDPMQKQEVGSGWLALN